jgi:hypothetical protein
MVANRAFDPAVAAQAVEKTRAGPAPYLILAGGWFALLLLFGSIRTNEPIFLWVLTQELILEKLFEVFGVAQSRWVGRTILLAAYLLAGLCAWAIVERRGRSPVHRWRRAVLAWFGIQAIYAVIATGLVQAGLLRE